MVAIADIEADEGELVQATARLAPGTRLSENLRFKLEATPELPDAQFDELSGVLRWLTDEDDGGTISNLRITATDGDQDTVIAEVTFRISIVEVNDFAPVFPGTLSAEVDAGQVLMIAVRAVDLDSPPRPLQYELMEPVPEGATMQRETGELRWPVPIETLPGFVKIQVRATETGPDSKSVAATLSVEIKQPRANRKQPEFSVIWERSANPSVTAMTVDLTANEVGDLVRSEWRAGRNPIVIAGYGDDAGKPRFVVVTQPGSDQHGAYLNLTQSEYNRRVNQHTLEGRFPAWVDYYSSGGDRRIAAIFPKSSVRWEARSASVPAAESYMRTALRSGFQVVRYSIDDDARHAQTLFLQGIPATTLHVGLREAQVKELLMRVPAGQRPIWIDSYWLRVNGQDEKLYTCILQVGASPQSWAADIGLLPHELLKRAQDRQRQGMSPVVVTVR